MTVTDIIDIQFSLILLIAFCSLINTVIIVIILSAILGDYSKGDYHEP